jgi:dTMP kinase
VQGSRRPDLTLLLDLPVETGLARAAERSEPDRIEKQQVDFFERVRKAYLDIAEREPDRVKIIDASLELEQVQAQIRTVMMPRLQAGAA